MELKIPDTRYVRAKDFDGELRYVITASRRRELDEVTDDIRTDFAAAHPDLPELHIPPISLISFAGRVTQALKGCPAKLMHSVRAQSVGYFGDGSMGRSNGLISVTRIQRIKGSWYLTKYEIYTRAEWMKAHRKKDGIKIHGNGTVQFRQSGGVTISRRESIVVPISVPPHIGLRRLTDKNIFIITPRDHPTKGSKTISKTLKKSAAMAQADRERLDWLEKNMIAMAKDHSSPHSPHRVAILANPAGSDKVRDRTIRGVIDKAMAESPAPPKKSHESMGMIVADLKPSADVCRQWLVTRGVFVTDEEAAWLILEYDADTSDRQRIKDLIDKEDKKEK
jgi:hypothetical protein